MASPFLFNATRQSAHVYRVPRGCRLVLHACTVVGILRYSSGSHGKERKRVAYLQLCRKRDYVSSLANPFSAPYGTKELGTAAAAAAAGASSSGPGEPPVTLDGSAEKRRGHRERTLVLDTCTRGSWCLLPDWKTETETDTRVDSCSRGERGDSVSVVLRNDSVTTVFDKGTRFASIAWKLGVWCSSGRLIGGVHGAAVDRGIEPFGANKRVAAGVEQFPLLESCDEAGREKRPSGTRPGYRR